MSQLAVTPKAEDTWGTAPRLLALVTSIAVLAIGVPLSLLFIIPDSGRSDAWVLTWIVSLWGGVRLSVLWVGGTARLFDFFFWLYTYLFMGVAATVQLRANDVPMTTPAMSPSLDMPTAWVVVLGIATYELGRGVWLLLRRHAAQRDVRPVEVSGVRSVLLYLVGLGLAAYYLAKVGPSIITTTRYQADAMLNNTWSEPAVRAIFVALAVYPILVGTGAVVQARRQIPVGRSSRWVLGLMGLGGVAALAAVASPISSARYTFGTVAFAILVYAGVLRTPGRTRLAMSGMIVAMIFLFPVLDIFRGGSTDTGARSSFFSEYSGNPDYDSFWQIGNALSYSVSDSMVPFRQILGSLMFWMPRVWWPDKPTDTGIMLADFRGYSFGNLSAPMWAEMLVNGGVILVGVGFFLLGIVLASLDRKMAPAHLTGGWWGIIGAILPVYLMILMRGSLLQATGALVVALVGLFWVRRGRPADRPGPAALRSPPY